MKFNRTPVLLAIGVTVLAVGGIAMAALSSGQAPSGAGDSVVLKISPSNPAPGDSVAMTVQNDTTSTVAYGLDFRIERKVDGAWKDVTASDQLLANPSPMHRLPAILVAPGTQESGYSPGPSGAEALPDEFVISEEAAAGTYRVVKEIRMLEGDAGQELAGSPTVEISADFLVGATN